MSDALHSGSSMGDDNLGLGHWSSILSDDNAVGHYVILLEVTSLDYFRLSLRHV